MLPATLTFAQTRDCDITEQYVDWDNSINFIFMMDQNLPPLQNNILIGEKHQLYFHEVSKFATPYDQYVKWGNNINFIFMRDQHQEGGTSTPGKRPGCSDHVSTYPLVI